MSNRPNSHPQFHRRHSTRLGRRRRPTTSRANRQAQVKHRRYRERARSAKAPCSGRKLRELFKRRWRICRNLGVHDRGYHRHLSLFFDPLRLLEGLVTFMFWTNSGSLSNGLKIPPEVCLCLKRGFISPFKAIVRISTARYHEKSKLQQQQPKKGKRASTIKEEKYIHLISHHLSSHLPSPKVSITRRQRQQVCFSIALWGHHASHHSLLLVSLACISGQCWLLISIFFSFFPGVYYTHVHTRFLSSLQSPH